MNDRLIGLTLALSIGLTATAHAASPPSHASAKRAAVHRVATSHALQAGISNYNRGYIAKAVPLLERATREKPGSEQAFLWLARARYKQGSQADFEKAKLAYQQVLRLNPDNREALSNLGELWSWDPARRSDAVALLKHAYDLNPSDPVVGKRLAEALLWQGNAMDALRYAAPVANRYRADRKFMTEYAQILSQTGHADQALEIYNTVLKAGVAQTGPLQLGLKMDQARALQKSGQKQAAQALYNELARTAGGTALARDNDFIQSMASLAFDLDMPADTLKWDQSLPEFLRRQKNVQLRTARALTRVYRVPEAIDYFNRLYEAGLLNVNEKLEFAEYLRMQHLPPEGLPSPNLIENLYREAMQEQPSNGEAVVRLARYYGELDGKFSETVTAYRQALEMPDLQNRETVKKELLDFIKADKTQPQLVEGLFQQLLAANPNDILVKKSYAEFLSWQTSRRAEAMRIYVDLAKADPENRELWEARLEEVLKWHQPTTDLIPVYQEIVNLYPQNKAIWMSVARAYRNNKDYYREAVETYGKLVKRYPDDGTLKKEWLGLLLGNAGQRGENIRLLEKMLQEDPSDLDVLASYGKLQSYDRHYGKAMDAFKQVLSKNPEHREALVGKGYVILWSGRKLEAKDYFSDLRQRFPDDVDIAIGLASAEKEIGRYDQALKIIEEIKPLMQKTPESGDAWELRGDYRLVGNVFEAPSLAANAVPDYSIQPYGEAVGTVAKPAPIAIANAGAIDESALNAMGAESGAVRPSDAMNVSADATTVPADTKQQELQNLKSEIDSLNAAVEALKALQASSRTQMDQLGQAVKTSKDVVAGEMNLQGEQAVAGLSGPMGGNVYGNDQGAAYTGAGYSGGPYGIGQGAGDPGSGSYGGARTAYGATSVGQGGMRPVLGTYAALDYDTNPLLSGLGRFRNDDMISDLERGLLNDLRPMLRGGFLYSRQGGEATTTALHSYGFPNQLSFSLTPQIRLRGGIRPTRLYLPNGVSPDSTWGIEYGMGTTIKYWDRLTLDGDIAITHFTQSGSENVTFQAQAQYDFTDSIRAKLGFRRFPQYNSLLSVAGQKPNAGAFRGDLVGQARENGVYGELNLNPFSKNVDWNLGYEWAFIDGEHIPRNYKNQAFTSLGYTWHYAANHQVRIGYEFLYFGYSKNATNGYFDTTANGSNDPVVQLRPVIAAAPGYVFGGYFSPAWFILNAGRLDFRGSLFNKFLEYKVGGSLGGQVFGVGRDVDDDEAGGASLASSFDANLIMNFTDWLAAYGNVDFLDAGGQFNRWRFGGGLILRPHIRALSPVFGQPTARQVGKR